MSQIPFLLRPTGRRKGVFATRGPLRPNPIGLHLVRIESVRQTPPTIAFWGVDMEDETPVLDIKTVGIALRHSTRLGHKIGLV
jgi:tRNA (Thr-GGU) A37 N-methylase